MSRFLLDANLSPQTRHYLTARFGFDVIDLLSYGRRRWRDEEIVALAVEQERIVLTFDLDFGPLFRSREAADFGVIILRLESQTVEAVNQALDRFFRVEAPDVLLKTSLVVIDEARVRVAQTR